jgi:hypothetical protein
MNKTAVNSFKKILFVAFLWVAAIACTTPRSIIKTPLKSQGESYLLEKMSAAETKFTSLNTRINFTLVDEKKSKTNLNGQLRILKDSIIWISLSPALGIEAARLVLTQDSIKFINRLDKTYFVGDFNFVNQIFGTTVDFDMVQAIITGNDMENYDKENFRGSIDQLEYKLSATNRLKRKKILKQTDTPNVLVQNIWLDPSTFKITRINLKEFNNENIKLQATYSDFETINNQLIPQSIQFELHGGKKLNLFFNYSKIEIDNRLSFPFKVPDSFNKMK